MPAQKRPLPSPTPDDSAWAPRVAVRHSAASGDGGRGGASHEMDGEASARQERPPHRHRGPRDGDPDDKEVGGCGGGDGTDTNGESSLSPSAGSMEDCGVRNRSTIDP